MGQNKDTIWGYYRKYHRMINSSYFSKQTSQDKEAMLSALDSDYPISTARIKAILTIFWMIIIYGIASTIWGFALNGSILWFAIGGAIIGFLSGGFSALVIAKQRTVERANYMQSLAGGSWVPVGLYLGAIGAVVWTVRVIFFR